MITQFLSRLRLPHLHARHNPARDWFLMCGVFVVMLIIIISWDVWTFKVVESGEISPSEVESSTPVLNRAAIDRVTKLFEERAVEEEKYKTGSYHFSDPSQ